MNIITISAGSNCHLISDGERHLMIDAGAPGMGAKIERTLAQNKIAMEQISYLVLTHGHSDHIGNAAVFQKKGTQGDGGFVHFKTRSTRMASDMINNPVKQLPN